ncbi:rhomboid family intramembrane serine protease [Mucilaginibacter lutimaris]
MIRSGNKLVWLIGINIIVFLIINVPAVAEQLFITGFGNSHILAFIHEYLFLPASLPKLLHRFWTPFTYMFMHSGPMHVLFNMAWLYWMGQIFEDFLGNKRTIGLYLFGGLTGGVLFVACYNLLPAFTNIQAASFSSVVGASASVMAVVVATATLLPNYTVGLFLIGPVKLKYLVIFMVIIDFILIAEDNPGGEIAHLGGALFGFIYIKQMQRGNDWILGINKLFAPKPKLRVVSNNTNQRKASTAPKQEDLDRILDKISATGYDSLSKQEKETLDNLSKQ